MQGPSEFGIGGNLAKWDVKDRLKEIKIPTLMVGAKHDTMDPKAMEEQSKLVQKGRYYIVRMEVTLPCMMIKKFSWME